MEPFITIINVALITYIGVSGIYFLVFAVASKLSIKTETKTNTKKAEVTIMIPAYKEDSVIIESTISAVNHVSKLAVAKVLIIADSLENETMKRLENTSASVIPVSFKKSTKAKAINYAAQFIDRNCEYVVVLDADNIMEPGCLDELVKKTQQGYKVVQGHRSAKNQNTSMAMLDGLSEEINNSIFRKGHEKLGLSSALIGSGFICEHSLFVNTMQQIDAVSGFDKELEVLLIKSCVKIGYAHSALVLDEKVQAQSDFVKQRRRWIAAQVFYLRKYFGLSLLHLFKHGNIDLFDKVFQFIVPPRALAIGIASLVFFINLILSLVNGSVLVSFIVWAGISIILALAIFIAIPTRYFNSKTLKSVTLLPSGIVLTIWAALQIKGANKKFIHTKHGIQK